MVFKPFRSYIFQWKGRTDNKTVAPSIMFIPVVQKERELSIQAAVENTLIPSL